MKPKTNEYTVAVVVARFQVPELTEAHRELINLVIANHPKVLIYLGLSPLRGSITNPLDFQPRKQMILEAYPPAQYPNITIGYIKDQPSDDVWSSELDRQIGDLVSPKDNVILYGGRDSFIPHYKGRYPVQELVSNRYISGTEIRKIVAEKPQAHPLFRAGAIWSTHQRHATVYTTVDVAVYDPREDRLLVARKSNEKLWRFVGGFVSPEDNSIEVAAARELYEETNLVISHPTFEYLGSFKIDDWRYRREVDKIISHFYLSFYGQGCAQAKDDIAEVAWFARPSLTEDQIVSEHREMFRTLLKRLDSDIPIGRASFNYHTKGTI